MNQGLVFLLWVSLTGCYAHLPQRQLPNDTVVETAVLYFNELHNDVLSNFHPGSHESLDSTRKRIEYIGQLDGVFKHTKFYLFRSTRIAPEVRACFFETQGTIGHVSLKGRTRDALLPDTLVCQVNVLLSQESPPDLPRLKQLLEFLLRFTDLSGDEPATVLNDWSGIREDAEKPLPDSIKTRIAPLRAEKSSSGNVLRFYSWWPATAGLFEVTLSNEGNVIAFTSKLVGTFGVVSITM
jgi:hypothetical protein